MHLKGSKWRSGASCHAPNYETVIMHKSILLIVNSAVGRREAVDGFVIGSDIDREIDYSVMRLT